MFYNQPRKLSAKKFHYDMKLLWQQNAECTIHFINNAIVNSPETKNWSLTLVQNQQSIANGIIRFCGDREKLSYLFNQFIQPIGQAVDILVWKKDSKKLRENWYKKADELTNIIHSLSTWNVREYFYKQISLIESLIKSLDKKKKEAIAHYRNELIDNNIKLSEIFTDGIIADNKAMFI